ncbi:hypothetical protein F8160_02380 [Bacillus sp. CH126_4D]|uniref:hypothetical protein n=1 Tax=unclassified Bacillus (in: firmicutes) TaxID=185979 RepID=UPI00124EB946|nr:MULTISPECIES: hypothetical protein [unclassified Bacillus (in: firmicutes)]KAB2460943.1 hypothetical protein F8162_00305 [Bacillus sp. CH140a_4T]KAB2475025.1 hypothetical protein F8160_02380 [Bacillus sp. CH126_4D]
MYSIQEAQAMDYLLKKLHYNGLLEHITRDKNELKLVIAINNRYISGDFIMFQKGSIEQYEIVGSYEYEKVYYNNQSFTIYAKLWSSFCNKYLPTGSNYRFKQILDLTVIFDLLNEIVGTISFVNEPIPLRPVFMNIEYFNEEKGPEFLYLGSQQIEIVSIMKREKGLNA